MVRSKCSVIPVTIFPYGKVEEACPAGLIREVIGKMTLLAFVRKWLCYIHQSVRTHTLRSPPPGLGFDVIPISEFIQEIGGENNGRRRTEKQTPMPRKLALAFGDNLSKL